MSDSFFEQTYETPNDDPLRADEITTSETEDASNCEDASSKERVETTTIYIDETAPCSQLQELVQAIRDGWTITDMSLEVKGKTLSFEGLCYAVPLERESPPSLFDF